TQPGTYTFTVTATDPNPQVPTASKTFTLTVNPAAVSTCATPTAVLQQRGYNIITGTAGPNQLSGTNGTDAI
ncbi:hypothetical protein, partial [Streptomyces sp. NRRL F-2664]|uniref:hypothetical protein n=1 Tax=Streptomyces sp. NRRL F-2664 TaxID=1463842 RepID=UPI0005BB31C8